MKKCPNCQQVFDDTNDFCANDGTTLVGISPTGFDTPTQVFRTPYAGATPAPVQRSSPMLYLVIGILVAAVAGMGIYLFMLREPAKQNESSNATAPKTTNSTAGMPSAYSTAASSQTSGPVNQMASVPNPPATNPNLSPRGNWSGQISYGSGSAFSAQASLTDSETGHIGGQIVWRLLRTNNPQKVGRVGSSATEFVQGTFDPASRTVLINGVNVTDSELIIRTNIA